MKSSIRRVAWIGLLCVMAVTVLSACDRESPTVAVPTVPIPTVAVTTVATSTPDAGVTEAIGICGRTPRVRGAILDQLVGVEECAEVTAEHLATVPRLDLGDDWLAPRYPLTVLKRGDFDGLSSLTRLDLSHNQLTALPKGIFDQLISLEGLDMAGNDLTSLPTGIFDQLISLEALDMAGNDLTSLPSGIFDSLTSLVHLDLGSNHLFTLPKGAFDRLTLLGQLDLERNQLQSLSTDIFDELSSPPRTPSSRQSSAVGPGSLRWASRTGITKTGRSAVGVVGTQGHTLSIGEPVTRAFRNRLARLLFPLNAANQHQGARAPTSNYRWPGAADA